MAIGSMAQDVVQSQFAEPLRSGRLQWLSFDYDEPQHEHFKQDYELVSSNVVVVRRVGGKDSAWQRLDEVWDLVHDEPAFRSYVAGTIRAALAQSAR